MKKILVTGGAGYIGSHVVYAMLDAGYEVVVVDDLSTGVRQNLPKDLIFYKCDVGDRAAISKILQDEKPNAIMHFAGSIVVPESVTDPLKYYMNNVAAGISFVNTCIEHAVSHFIFSSTAAVYGVPENGQSLKEDAQTNPINPYGHSKLMLEQILSDIAKIHPKFHYATLRYFNVAGADPKGRTGQTGGLATHLIKIASQVVSGKRDILSICGDDYPTKDGTCVRDYVHVDDLAQAHKFLLEHIMKEDISIILNCGTGKGYSVKDVIATFDEVLETPLPTQVVERRVGDSPVLVADPSKLTALTGWKTRYSLRDMVESAIAWEKQL